MIVLLSQSVAPPPTRRVRRCATPRSACVRDSYSVGVHTGNLGRGQVALGSQRRRRPAVLGASQRRPCVRRRPRARRLIRRRVRQICFRRARHRQRLPPRRRLPMAASGRMCSRSFVAWRTRTQGTAGGHHAAGLQIADSPQAALRSPASGSIPPRRCTVTASAVRERLTRHADDGAANVHRLLDAPWSDEALASDATRRLLSRRGCVQKFARRLPPPTLCGRSRRRRPAALTRG